MDRVDATPEAGDRPNQTVRWGPTVKQPLVTAFITSHNHARFVEESVGSVLDQTFLDLELLVIDDGSTDGSPEILRSYLEKRSPEIPVRLILRERRGRIPTLKQGLEMATGKYFASLVSDDTWEPDRLEREVPVLEASGPEVAACYGDCWVIDAQGNRVDRLGLWAPYRGGDIYRDLVTIRYVPPNPTALFLRAAIPEVGGFNDRLHFVDDWDMWLKIAGRYQVAFVPRPLGSWRNHGGNATAKGLEEFLADARVTFEDLIARDPKLPIEPERIRAGLDTWYAGHLYNLLRLSEARRAALDALRRWPTHGPAWNLLLRSLLGPRLVSWFRDRRRERRLEVLKASEL